MARILGWQWGLGLQWAVEVRWFDGCWSGNKYLGGGFYYALYEESGRIIIEFEKNLYN